MHDQRSSAEPPAPRRDWAQLKDKWSALHTIALFVVLVGGAGWTWAIRTKPDLAKAQTELEEARHILADVALSERAWSIDGRCIMVITASVQNKGRRAARIDLRGNPWQLAIVDVDSSGASYRMFRSGAPKTVKRDQTAVVDLPVTTLVPGESATYEIATEVPPGTLMFAEFRVPISEAIDAFRGGAEAWWFWTARAHLPTCDAE